MSLIQPQQAMPSLAVLPTHYCKINRCKKLSVMDALAVRSQPQSLVRSRLCQQKSQWIHLCHCEPDRAKRFPHVRGDCFVATNTPRNDIVNLCTPIESSSTPIPA